MAVLRSTVVRQAAARSAAFSSSSVLCAVPSTALNFTITRQPPLLVAPDRPTARQSLYLSNIDDQSGLRYKIPKLLFDRNDSSKKKNEEDPVKVVKEALAKVVVHYYPFAGRLRDADNGKFTVDCTGEGVLFVEADADISLEEFGDLYPPIPHGDDFINNVPGSELGRHHRLSTTSYSVYGGILSMSARLVLEGGCSKFPYVELCFPFVFVVHGSITNTIMGGQ